MRQLVAKFADILVRAKGINFKHVQYTEMAEDRLTVRNAEVSIKDEKFIYGLPT